MTATLFPLLFLVTAGVEVVAPDAGALADGGAAAVDGAPEVDPTSAVAGADVGQGAAARQHRSAQPDRRGTHELRDPGDWPSEPATPAGVLDDAQFDAALVALCD